MQKTQWISNCVALTLNFNIKYCIKTHLKICKVKFKKKNSSEGGYGSV